MAPIALWFTVSDKPKGQTSELHMSVKNRISGHKISLQHGAEPNNTLVLWLDFISFPPKETGCMVGAIAGSTARLHHHITAKRNPLLCLYGMVKAGTGALRLSEI